jgi:hypothetical protein
VQNCANRVQPKTASQNRADQGRLGAFASPQSRSVTGDALFDISRKRELEAITKHLERRRKLLCINCIIQLLHIRDIMVLLPMQQSALQLTKSEEKTPLTSCCPRSRLWKPSSLVRLEPACEGSTTAMADSSCVLLHY